MLKETFFSLLLSKMLNTTALTSSLAVCCESKDKPLLLLGVMLGLIIQIILCNTLTATMEYSATMIQMSLSIMVMVLATIAGYHSTKNFKKHQQIVISRILNLVLLPACFISSQSIDIVLYLAHQKLDTVMILSTYLWSLLLCSLFGLGYHYISVTYFTPSAQKCVSSFILYFTGAVFASKVFEYMNLMIHPPVLIQNIVFTIRERQQNYYVNGMERFKHAILSKIFDIDSPRDNLIIGTGYSVYWFIISFCLIYDLKKYK